MAGVVPILPPRTGNMAGKLVLETERSITLDELLAHTPSAKTFLNELSGKGWKYYFIDGYGKVELEFNLDSYPYNWQTYEHPRGGFAYKLTLGLLKNVTVANVRHNYPVVGIYQGHPKSDIFHKGAIDFFTLFQCLQFFDELFFSFFGITHSCLLAN